MVSLCRTINVAGSGWNRQVKTIMVIDLGKVSRSLKTTCKAQMLLQLSIHLLGPVA